MPGKVGDLKCLPAAKLPEMRWNKETYQTQPTVIRWPKSCMNRIAGLEKPVDARFVARPAGTVNFD
jgi:hypothetical protein